MKTVITNTALYNETVSNVELNNVKNVTDNSFYGNVTIELSNGSEIETDGEFGFGDYEDEFGFRFEK